MFSYFWAVAFAGRSPALTPVHYTKPSNLGILAVELQIQHLTFTSSYVLDHSLGQCHGTAALKTTDISANRRLHRRVS